MARPANSARLSRSRFVGVSGLLHTADTSLVLPGRSKPSLPTYYLPAPRRHTPLREPVPSTYGAGWGDLIPVAVRMRTLVWGQCGVTTDAPGASHW